MANDDRQSDQFIREVDEEIRREQLKTLWDRFGLYIIGTCVAVVAITGGYRGWIWWEGKVAAERGDRYIAASTLLSDGNPTEASSLLEELEADGGSYGVLARLRLAGIQASEGNNSEAIAAFDDIATDSSVETIMRDLARVRSALLMLDEGDAAGAAKKVKDLSNAGNAWRHSAREIQATAAYMNGELEEARDLLLSIEQDAVAPSDARQRAALMLSLVDSLLPDPAADVSGSDAASEGAIPPSSPADTIPDTDGTDSEPGSGNGG